MKQYNCNQIKGSEYNEVSKELCSYNKNHYTGAKVMVSSSSMFCSGFPSTRHGHTGASLVKGHRDVEGTRHTSRG